MTTRAWVILDDAGRVVLASDRLEALGTMLVQRWARGELRGPLRLDEATQAVDDGPGADPAVR